MGDLVGGRKTGTPRLHRTFPFTNVASHLQRT